MNKATINRVDALFYLQFIADASHMRVRPSTPETINSIHDALCSGDTPQNARTTAARYMRQARRYANECRGSDEPLSAFYRRDALFWAVIVRILGRIEVVVIEDVWGIRETSEQGWLIRNWPTSFDEKDVLFRYAVGPSGVGAVASAQRMRDALRMMGAASVDVETTDLEHDVDLRLTAFHEIGARPCRWRTAGVVSPVCLTHKALAEQVPGICSDRLRWLDQRATELPRLGSMVGSTLQK